jgi:DNA modification methylase
MKRNPLKEQPIPAGLGKILLAHLIPDAKNPRKDLKKGDPEFEKINKSVEKFGQLDPIVFNTRTRKILGGHQRLKVLDSQGYTELYTVTLGAYTWAFAEADLKELSEKEENAANIALNKAQGDWNIEQLTINLQELKLDDMLEFTGFDDIEFDGLIRDLNKDDEPLDAEPQISRAEELRKEWGTELGQMWQCGEHRVICGDCTDPAVVERVMGGAESGIMVTDPPYGVEYEPEWRDKLSNSGKGVTLRGHVINDNIVDWTKALELFKGNVAYVWHAGKFAAEVAVQLHTIGFEIRNQIIWKKPHFALSRGDYHWQHEPCWYAVRKGNKSEWCGDRTQSTVWDIANFNPAGNNQSKEVKTSHGTQKPIECMSRPIKNHNFDTVYDPFLGSGTTMIACENLGRKCRGCEIDPGYVAVELQRYKDTFPGKEIKLLS